MGRMMKLNIQKWGNSAAIRLPSAMLSEIGAGIGDAVEIDPKAFRIARPKYKLKDLVAQCNHNAPAPADVVACENASPVGAEIF